MSQCVPTPMKLVKPHQQKVLTIVSPTAKLFFVLLALLLYVLMIIFFKTIMEREKQYDRMDNMLMEAKQMIRKIYAMAQKSTMEIERFKGMFKNY